MCHIVGVSLRNSFERPVAFWGFDQKTIKKLNTTEYKQVFLYGNSLLESQIRLKTYIINAIFMLTKCYTLLIIFIIFSYDRLKYVLITMITLISTR